MAVDRDEWIRRRAYETWESEERPQGEDIKHWMQALDEFNAQNWEKDADKAESDPADLPAGADEDRGKDVADVEPPAHDRAPEDAGDITTGEEPAGKAVSAAEGP
jgi:hypothetical protein